VAAGIPNQPLGPDVGILPICCPDPSQGRQQLPLSAVMGYPEANKTMKRGYIQSWNLIVEHKLPGELVASVGYVGTHSVNGFGFLQLNASQPARRYRTAFYAAWGRPDTRCGMAAQASTTRCKHINRRMTAGLFVKGHLLKAINTADYGWTIRL
jgi:hypothetical protein